jgi:hypothetical protein
MTTPMNFEEEYRLMHLQKAHNIISKKPSDEVLRAQHIVAKNAEEIAEARAILEKASAQHCPSLYCPPCFFQRGVTVPLETASSNTNIDLFRCPTCGHTYGQYA